MLYHSGREDPVLQCGDERPYYAICEGLIQQNKDELLTAPVAIQLHHACIGGLLMHISGMLSCADFVAQQ